MDAAADFAIHFRKRLWELKNGFREPCWWNSLLHSVGTASGAGAKKPDTVTYEIKFVIVSSGNVTPTSGNW